MSQSFEIQGQIHSIGETTSYGNNGFTKREFVIKLTGEGENPAYPNHVAMELLKDNCGIMDAYKLGDEIKAHFNLSGRLWSGNGKPEKCFTSLQAWRVQAVTAGSQQAPTAPDFDYNQDPTPDYSNIPPPRAPEPMAASYGNSAPAPAPAPPANNFGNFEDDIPF